MNTLKVVLLFLSTFYTICLSAQKESTSFIFGHSLIHHEFQINPTPSQETSIPHWMHFLSEEANHNYQVSGQYGFLPQHANLPPIAQWGFDFAASAWESDYESFSEADFNNIIITPANFVQWQAPIENYPMQSISPVDATETIINWCNQEEMGLSFYLYENWPDMAPYLNNGFPPAEDEWTAYNDYLNEDFHQWFIDYQDELVERIPNACIKMIPVGPLISHLLDQSPYSNIAVDQLYEDDAPHGRASIYFLGSLIVYMATFEEKPPASYQVESIIHPIIADNYGSIVEIFWDALMEFNYPNGESRVFCNAPLSSLSDNSIIEIEFRPNPVEEFLIIEGLDSQHVVDIHDALGNNYKSSIHLDGLNNTIDLSALISGIYFLSIKDKSNKVIYTKTFIKQ